MGRHPPSARRLTFAALALTSGFCLALIAGRPWIVGELGQLYLVWNLFLAWIPFVLALCVYERARSGRRDAGQMVLMAAWLAFLPNAPYIVTDFVHVPERIQPPEWYDVSIYAAFAWTGMLLGLVSLYLVHVVVRTTRGAGWGWAAVAASVTLSGFGIYLGRFLGWNSWDLLTRPGDLLADVVAIAREPLGEPLAVTVLFAGFVGVAYLVLYAFAELRNQRGHTI
jgi:uncharacterized membrane protein